MFNKIQQLKPLIRHILEIDPQTRSNDTLLQIKALQRLGLATYLDHTSRFGSCYIIREKDILNGKISRSFNTSVRRTRQKIQEAGELLPRDTVLEQRMKAQEQMRKQISLEVSV